MLDDRLPHQDTELDGSQDTTARGVAAWRSKARRAKSEAELWSGGLVRLEAAQVLQLPAKQQRLNSSIPEYCTVVRGGFAADTHNTVAGLCFECGEASRFRFRSRGRDQHVRGIMTMLRLSDGAIKLPFQRSTTNAL